MGSPPPDPPSPKGSSSTPVPLYDGGFQALLNFRDVGATVNGRLSRRLIREGLLFRAARPDEATLADRDRLRSHYTIRTVMDLRTKTEHVEAARKRRRDAAVPALLQTNDALAGPVKIDGIDYREVKITGGGFEKFMLSQLCWSSFLRLVFLYLVGLRMQAIAVLGREVMQPRGLLGLGRDTLDASGPEVASGLASLLEPDGLPMLIHCTQGKDRTGIMVVLVLLICAVPVEAIQYDYHLSDEKLLSEEQARLVEIREMGLGDDFAKTAPGFVSGIVDHLESKHGGLPKYLDSIGFGVDKRAALREKLAY
ncbi:putative tyrosine serine protein phosphatase [Diaporthe ampelina]|uniref:Putative tyrosine serine protein phosphatase n=1 Tax=Diaporthe ampelina TaxID=1214573 RepID=A0A0G2F6H0_9PEZI|nr:putative tyrosine serine protein phosphatase [Diaporthe ampelina]